MCSTSAAASPRSTRGAALEALGADLGKALADDEVERRGLAKALLPYVREFYRDCVDPGRHDPFYRSSSRT